MTIAINLAQLDAEWDAIARVEQEPALRPRPATLNRIGVATDAAIEPTGAFGHGAERRLGLRIAANLWALARGRDWGCYVRVVELSTTGAVIEPLEPDLPAGAWTEELGLHVFLGDATPPIRVRARPVRVLGARAAVELVDLGPAERLTLAEHLDRVLVCANQLPGGPI